ncbi:unnamed protein product [Boreogadus saida]
MYSEMSDTQLDALVLEIHRIHLCGYRMLRYHLQGRGHLVQKLSDFGEMFTQVLDLFHTLFHEMEASWMLNPDSEIHLFALHWVFQSLVQSHLRHFQDAWNFHSLRTENSQSPYQLWLRNMLLLIPQRLTIFMVPV